MFFVDRSEVIEPASIKTYQLEYRAGWNDYVHRKKARESNVKQPTDNKWTDSSVREPLYSLFNGNCGYCGCFTHKDTSGDTVRYFGHVDHFVPKSVNADLVYSWRNYIWSCKDCNERKHEFYDDPFILNPTSKDDVSLVYFSIMEGKFFLKKDNIGNPNLKKLYENTLSRTLINLDSKAQERKTLIEDILFLLRNCCRFYDVGDNSVFNDFKNRLISKVYEATSYKLILKSVIEKFFEDNPTQPIKLEELYPNN